MKTKALLKFVFAIILGLSFLTCQKIELVEEQSQPKPFTLLLLAQSGSALTKAAYTGLEFAWEAGDLAAIVAPNNFYSPLSLDSLSAGKKLGLFSGTLNGWEGEKEIYAIYPWSADGKERFNQTNNSYGFILSDIQSSADQVQDNKNNARYSLMLGKTKTGPVANLNIELHQMMSFIDFKISNVGNYTIREIQIESNDSVFLKTGIFKLSDFSVIPGKKIKKISVVNNIGYQPGDITLPITLFPVDLSPTGLNKELFADVIAEDNTTGHLKLFRLNKGVPSKAYEKNTRYQAFFDLSAVTPIPYENELYISQSVQNTPYLESSFTISIHTNGQKWSATNIPDWITLSKSFDATSSDIAIKVKTNTHFLPRTGAITFSSGNEQKTLTVNQALNQEVAGDKAALETFFAAAGGENWTNKTNWLSDKPLGEWNYIITNVETGRVNTLAIRNSENLRGYMSDDVYKLSELKELFIFNMEPHSFKIEPTPEIKNLQKLEILYLELTGNIPNEIFELSQLKYLQLRGMEVFNIKLIGEERFSNLSNLEELIFYADMGVEFPKGVLVLKNLTMLALASPNTSSTVVPESLYNLTNLKWIDLGDYKLRFSPSIGKLTQLEHLMVRHVEGELPKEFFSLSKLNWAWIGSTLYQSDLSGSILPEIKNMTNLNAIGIINCNLTGNLPKELANLPLEQFRCDGNRLSGVIPLEVTSHPNWEKWSPNRWVLPQQEGYKLEIEKYVSTDYSEDGKIVKLHSATRGKGIDIVVLGDGFVDKEIGPGKIYDLTMTKFKDSFLELEPFKTYKDYFNIYMIRAVSKEHGVSDEGNRVQTKFGTITSQNDYPSYNREKVRRYVDSLGLDNSHINLIANSYAIHANAAIVPDENTGIVKTATLIGVNADTYVISHESGGHGFGLLADEYMFIGEEYIQIPSFEAESHKQMQEKYSIYPNVDFTSDLTRIRWAHMVNHPKYKGIVGAYEGGLYYYKGVWRAEYQSIMGYGYGVNYFNAPSREAIVKQIKKQAGETYSFDDFVANDKMEYIQVYKSATIPKNDGKHYPPRVVIDGKEMKY